MAAHPRRPTADRDTIAALALAITEQARARYTLSHKTRHRLLTDLAAPGTGLNQKLTAWWEPDFAGFLAEVRVALKRELSAAPNARNARPRLCGWKRSSTSMKSSRVPSSRTGSCCRHTPTHLPTPLAESVS